MALTTGIVRTVRGAARLPLRLAGKAVGAVSSRLPDRGATRPAPAPAPATQKPAAEKPAAEKAAPATKAAPAKPAPAKKAAPAKKSTSAKKSTPAKNTSPGPTKKAPAAPKPVTAIDAEAATDDVDVTPADVAKVMGSELQDEKTQS